MDQIRIEKSIIDAEKILRDIRFPKEKINEVLLAIKEHDDHQLSPSTLEGKILKDADFLAGFGAWGILRIALWAGETRRGISQVFDRLSDRMKKRLMSLEFSESESWAIREIEFADLFLSLLNTTPDLNQVRRKGKYIVLEGISGSGKNTQADILQEHLEKEGYSVLQVDEPAEEYKEFRDLWKEHHKQLDDPMINAFFFMADRYEQIRRKVEPALNDGQIVISVRSYISTLVYQCKNEQERAAVAFAHQFVPVPDLILLYDLDAQISFDRIKTRSHPGMFEKQELLDVQRDRYLTLLNSGVFGKRAK